MLDACEEVDTDIFYRERTGARSASTVITAGLFVAKQRAALESRGGDEGECVNGRVLLNPTPVDNGCISSLCNR